MQETEWQKKIHIHAKIYTHTHKCIYIFLTADSLINLSIYLPTYYQTNYLHAYIHIHMHAYLGTCIHAHKLSFCDTNPSITYLLTHTFSASSYAHIHLLTVSFHLSPLNILTQSKLSSNLSSISVQYYFIRDIPRTLI